MTASQRGAIGLQQIREAERAGLEPESGDDVRRVDSYIFAPEIVSSYKPVASLPGADQCVKARNSCRHCELRRQRATGAVGLRVAPMDDMELATAVDRVLDDFNEMPGLELTLPQAVRLWNLGADDCRFAVEALVGAGFLKWTPRRTIMRTGRTVRRGDIGLETAHVRVRSLGSSDISVGS